MPETFKCRLCLSDSSEAGVDLFKECSGLIYAAQIKEALNLDVEEIPEWPREACLTCMVVLQKMFIFRGFVMENHKKLHLEYSQVRPVKSQERAAENGRRQQSPTDQIEEDFFVMVEEDVVEEADIEMEIIELDNFDAEAQDTPPRDSPASVILESSSPIYESPSDILIYELPSETPTYESPPDTPIPEALSETETHEVSIGSYSPLPSIIIEKEEDFISEIIEYESDSEVIDICSDSEGQNAVQSPSPSIDDLPAESVEKPKRVSLVRVVTTKLTAEEKELEAQMVEMRLFVCRVCEEDCNSLYELRRHVKAEHDFKKYNLCCKIGLTVSSVLLYDHIRWHLSSDSFKCIFCGSKFTQSSGLAGHMILVHSKGPPPLVCKVCGKGFHTNTQLSRHTLMHERKACKYCGKVFSPSFLPSHIRGTHEKKLRSLCDICGKVFPTPGRLSMHIKDHGAIHRGRRKKKLNPPVGDTSEFEGDFFASVK